MKYKGTYFNMWDTWYMNVNDTVHAFHLKAHRGDNWNVGHIYTNDLLHFKKMQDVLNPLPEEKYPDDCLGKYTGCAIEKDGKYYLYYTMRNRYGSENIGLAISEDLEHFTEYVNNPVLTPDKELFVVHGKDRKTDCRDMIVVFDDVREKYFGYFAAMADIEGRGELGVIGVAESCDLISWTNQKIVYVPDFCGVVEVPNVFKLENKWYMTLMTNAQYGAKGAVSDPNLNSYIISASSDAPDGVFSCGNDNVFLGSTRVNNGYALRCVEFKGLQYAMYVERSEYGSAISLPKEVKVIDGAIKPCYTDILKNIRTGTSYENFEFTRIPATFAWDNVLAGEIITKQNNIEVIGYPNSLQAFKAKIESVRSLEFEFSLSGDFCEAGAVIYTYDSKIEESYTPGDIHKRLWNGYAWSPYYISFNKRENLVILDKGLVDPVCRRQFDFDKNTKINVRIIAMEGQFELYINNVLFMECGIETKAFMAPGLFAFSGKAVVSGLKVYELVQ